MRKWHSGFLIPHSGSNIPVIFLIGSREIGIRSYAELVYFMERVLSSLAGISLQVGPLPSSSNLYDGQRTIFTITIWRSSKFAIFPNYLMKLPTFILKPTSPWRWLNGKRRLVYAVMITFIGLLIILYEVQYKTGIEIVPYFPIDQAGFDLYTPELLEEVEVSSAAEEQPKRGRLFCWVMTTSVYHKTRLPAVNETWLPNCDASHFLTDDHKSVNENTPYHTIFRQLPSSYFKLFWKTRLALFYIYRNISSEFDWYYKADDDTYAIIENLRDFLSDYDPNEPYYFGFRLKRRAPTHGYNAGGSGYILSRAAMKIFAEKLFEDRVSCPYHEWEDYAIGRCLASKGIYAQDTRDEKGRQRFLPWRPEYHFRGDLTKRFLMDPLEHRGYSIFHKNLIALHHLTAEEIRLIHELLYRVAPQGNKLQKQETSSVLKELLIRLGS